MNFLPLFTQQPPGLVGGQCIGVDPYYLTHKAQQLGYHPEVILTGRRINDTASHFARQQYSRQRGPPAQGGGPDAAPNTA